MPAHTPERRRNRCQRLPLAIPLFVRGVGKNGRSFLEFTSALNISASGVLVVMRRGLNVSSQLTLEIPCAPLHLRTSSTELVKSLGARLVRVAQREECELWGLKFIHPICRKWGICVDRYLIDPAPRRVDSTVGFQVGSQPPSQAAKRPKKTAVEHRLIAR